MTCSNRHQEWNKPFWLTYQLFDDNVKIWQPVSYHFVYCFICYMCLFTLIFLWWRDDHRLICFVHLGFAELDIVVDPVLYAVSQVVSEASPLCAAVSDISVYLDLYTTDLPPCMSTIITTHPLYYHHHSSTYMYHHVAKNLGPCRAYQICMIIVVVATASFRPFGSGWVRLKRVLSFSFSQILTSPRGNGLKLYITSYFC